MARQLRDYVQSLLHGHLSWQRTLLSAWPTIIGNLKTKVRLEKIEEDVLVLGVYEACWLQELYMLSPLLLATINKNLDQPRIKQLRFKRAGKCPVVRKKPSVSSFQKIAPLTLSAREQQALAHIKDPLLQDVLRKFLVRCHQER